MWPRLKSSHCKVNRNPKDRWLTRLKRTEEYPPWLTVDSWADFVATEFRCLDLAPWLVGLIWTTVLSSGTSLLGLSSLFFLSGSFGKEVWGSDVLGFEDSAAVVGVGVDTCLFLPGSSSAEIKIRMLLVKKVYVQYMFLTVSLTMHAKFHRKLSITAKEQRGCLKMIIQLSWMYFREMTLILKTFPPNNWDKRG